MAASTGPTFDDLFKAYAQAVRKSLSRPILFIVAPTMSGKSTLAAMLDRHDDIRFLSESHFPDELLPRLHDARVSYNRHVVARKKFANCNLPPVFLGRDFERFTFAAAMAVAVEAALDGENARYVGETTPDNIDILDLLVEIFVDVRVLHLVRDGRDAALAACRYNQARFPKRFPKEFGDRDTYLQGFAERWKSYVMKARALGNGLGGHYLEIRYEMLMRRPDKVLRQVFDWLELEASAAEIARGVDAGPFERRAEDWHCKNAADHPYHYGWKPGVWKTEMTPYQKKAFLSRARPLLDERGVVCTPVWSCPPKRVVRTRSIPRAPGGKPVTSR